MDGRSLAVPTPNERETLMYLGRGATTYAMNPVKAKADPAAWKMRGVHWWGMDSTQV